MKALVLALALVGLTHLATAQSRPEPAWEPITKLKGKHSLGINTQFTLDNLLDQNQSLPLDIRYKFFRKENRAWRAGVQFSYGYRRINTQSRGRFPDDITSTVFSSLTIGHEWRYWLSPRWSILLAQEIGFSWRRDSERVQLLDNQGGVVDFDLGRTYRYTPMYFTVLGVDFFITPKLYVNVETSAGFMLELKRYKFASSGTNSTSFSDGTVSLPSEESITSRYFSLSNLSINYLF